MNRLSSPIILSILLAGCATTSGYEAILNTWLGNTTDHLVSVWGVPQQQYRQRGGGVVLEYDRSGQVVLPGVTTYQPQTTYTNGTISAVGSNGNSINGTYGDTATTYVPYTSGPVVIEKRCITRFTADGNGRITNWSWEGNSCRAAAPKRPASPAATSVAAYQKCTADQLRGNGCS